jgi:hypothetical protein
MGPNKPASVQKLKMPHGEKARRTNKKLWKRNRRRKTKIRKRR